MTSGYEGKNRGSTNLLQNVTRWEAVKLPMIYLFESPSFQSSIFIYKDAFGLPMIGKI